MEFLSDRELFADLDENGQFTKAYDVEEIYRKANEIVTGLG